MHHLFVAIVATTWALNPTKASPISRISHHTCYLPPRPESRRAGNTPNGVESIDRTPK